MAYVQAPFAPDVPGAIVVPAHPDNVMRDRVTGDHKPINRPKVNVFHTPEEPADEIEVTPRYFSRQIFDAAGNQRFASTHCYVSGGRGTLGDGDLYQMVPERFGAIANGVLGKPYPTDTDPAVSLNYQSRSVEIEGYAATIHLTCPRGSKQWLTVVRWALAGHLKDGIPLDRAHNIGHYEVATNRSDPGALDIEGIIADARALAAAGDGEDDAIMPVPWVRAKEGQQRYRTYIIVGGRKRWVVSADEEQAFLESGYIARPVREIPVRLLKAIPSVAGTPEPDAP